MGGSWRKHGRLRECAFLGKSRMYYADPEAKAGRVPGDLGVKGGTMVSETRGWRGHFCKGERKGVDERKLDFEGAAKVQGSGRGGSRGWGL